MLIRSTVPGIRLLEGKASPDHFLYAQIANDLAGLYLAFLICKTGINEVISDDGCACPIG